MRNQLKMAMGSMISNTYTSMSQAKMLKMFTRG